MPKEMLTVVDSPAIQHVVDEARAAGIEHFIFVTGRNKAVIEDHFDRQPELEDTLTARGKTRELDILKSILPEAGATSFTRQQAPLGLGHAVWCARDIIGDEPFAVLLPDVIVQAEGKSCLAQMVDVYAERGGNVIAVEEKPDDELHNYGVISTGDSDASGTVWPIDGMVEKPKPGSAPSNLTIMGRYILQPAVMDILRTLERGAGNEIQLTDAMQKLMGTQPFSAVKYKGRSFDCGSKIGYLAANIAFALARPDLGPALRAEIKTLLA